MPMNGREAPLLKRRRGSWVPWLLVLILLALSVFLLYEEYPRWRRHLPVLPNIHLDGLTGPTSFWAQVVEPLLKGKDEKKAEAGFIQKSPAPQAPVQVQDTQPQIIPEAVRPFVKGELISKVVTLTPDLKAETFTGLKASGQDRSVHKLNFQRASFSDDPPRPTKNLARGDGSPVCVMGKNPLIWRHFGRNPYASSRDQAMADLERAISCLLSGVALPDGLVKDVVASSILQAIHKPGETGYLETGDHILAMLSREQGKVVVNKNVRVDFDKPAINGMSYAANMEVWVVRLKGLKWKWRIKYGRPEICNNLSILSIEKEEESPPPVVPPSLTSVPPCVEVSFNAPIHGKVRWGIGSLEPLPPNACNAQRQDAGAWSAWWGDCDYCILPMEYVEETLGLSAKIFQRYLYPVTSQRQTLRFSEEIWSRVVYICLEYVDVTQTCGVFIRPQDWQGRYHVEIPDSAWRRDDGSCPE